MGLGKNKTHQAWISLSQLHFKIRKEWVDKGANHTIPSMQNAPKLSFQKWGRNSADSEGEKGFLQQLVDPAQCLRDAKGTAWMVAESCSIQTSSTHQNSICALKCTLREQESGWRPLKLGKTKRKTNKQSKTKKTLKKQKEKEKNPTKKTPSKPCSPGISYILSEEFWNCAAVIPRLEMSLPFH